MAVSEGIMKTKDDCEEDWEKGDIEPEESE
jgi:hypothetical protein